MLSQKKKREEEIAYQKAVIYFSNQDYNKVLKILRPHYKEGAADNHPQVVALITKANNEKILSDVTECMMAQKFRDVIKILEPLHQNGYKLNLHMMKFLADAYIAEKNSNPDYLKRAIPLLKLLRSALKENMKTENPDYRESLEVILSLLQCVDNKVTQDLLIKEGMQIIKDHSKELLIRDEQNNLSNEYLNIAGYTLHMMAANLAKDNGNDERNYALQKAYYAKAKEYYAAALLYKPADLGALLNLSKVVLISPPQDVSAALNVLLPKMELYKNNPSYVYALSQLYSKLLDHARADEYNKRYIKLCQKGMKGEFVDIFTDLSGSQEMKTNSPLDRLRFAAGKFSKCEYKEAEEITSQLLLEYPEHIRALELSAKIKMNTGLYQEALSFSEKMLAIDQKSVIALELKAQCLWQNRASDHGQNELAAKLICEQVFQGGSRKISILSILIEYHFTHKNDRELLNYALEYIRLRPTPEMYLMVASAHHRLGDHAKALEAFQMVRIHDKYYEQENVSLCIIFCLFRLAATRKDYEICAKKLSSHLSHFGQGKDSSVIAMMLNQFKEMHIHVHGYAEQNENVQQPENESKQDDPYADWIVPQEIKDIINEAMSKMSFLSSRPLKQSNDPLAESGIDPKSVYPISDSVSAFIDPKAKSKLTDEQFEYFTDELKKGHVKKLVNGKGKWEITTSKVNCKYRLLTNATFFRPKPGNPEQQELVLRFGGKAKTHAGVRAALK